MSQDFLLRGPSHATLFQLPEIDTVAFLKKIPPIVNGCRRLQCSVCMHARARMHAHTHTHALIKISTTKEKREKEITCYQRLKVISRMCQGAKLSLKLTFFFFVSWKGEKLSHEFLLAEEHNWFARLDDQYQVRWGHWRKRTQNR